MAYRVTFDVPYQFVVRPAYERAQHVVDLAIESENGTYHDPAAGLLMLRPSVLDERWRDNIIPLSQLNYQSEHWRRATRGANDSLLRADFISRVRPRAPATLIDLLVDIAIVAASSSMKWVLQTIGDLARDEGFALHLTGADDEYSRENDFLFAQWDRYGIRLDTRGQLSLYLYNRADLTQSPTKIAEWHSGISSPVRSAMSLACIPVPPLGLLVLTIVSSGGLPSQSNASSTTRQLVSSKLVPGFELCENIGTTESPIYSFARASKLSVSINLKHSPILSFHRIRYPATGTVIERVHAIPPISAQVPTCTAIVGRTHATTVTATPLLEDGSPWNTAQSPNTYKVKLDLSSASSGLYSPVVIAHFTRAQPSIAARNTVPVIVDRVFSIELTTDEYARQEGVLEHLAEYGSAVHAIAMRGDTTYLLEYSANGTGDWTKISGGFAQIEKAERLYAPDPRKSPVRAHWNLRGFWSRFTEVHQMADTAFDNVTLADAYNKVLEAAGYPAIAAAELPADLIAIRLPSASTGETGHGWRYAPRVGQSGDEILRTLGLLATATGQEWRLRYDFGEQKWKLEPKPAGTPAWTLKPAGQHQPSLRIASYARLKQVPVPPEANLFWVEGATAPGKTGERLVVQLLNEDSLSEPSSLDYLGRIVAMRLQSDSLDTIARVDELAEHLYAVAGRHKMKFELEIPLGRNFDAAMLELATVLPRQIEIQLQTGMAIGTAYIKRATLSAELAGEQEEHQIQIEADTQFLSDPRE